MSGVEVRPLSRLPATGRDDGASRSRPGRPRASALYFAGDADHHHPRSEHHRRARDRAPPGAPGQAADRVRPAPVAADPSPRVPSRQGAAARPGASARTGRHPRRRGRAPDRGRLPRRAHPAGHRAAGQRRRGDRAGRGGQAAHLQGDRPGPPGGRARRLQHFNFGPEIEPIDDARVDKVIDELRDQNATLAAGRGPGGEGRRLRGHRVRRARATASPFEGGTLGADAAHPRPGAPDPGLRGQPRRPQGRRVDRVRHHLPGRLRRDRPWPARPPTSRSTSRSCARRSCRSSTTTSPSSWATSPTSPPCATDIRDPPRRATPSTGRATTFADRIIEYAVANATVELPDILVDQEVEVMHDEFRGTLARQGIERGGLPEGRREDRGGPPRRVPAGRREAGQDPARPLEGRRRAKA